MGKTKTAPFHFPRLSPNSPTFPDSGGVATPPTPPARTALDHISHGVKSPWIRPWTEFLGFQFFPYIVLAHSQSRFYDTGKCFRPYFARRQEPWILPWTEFL